MAEKQRTRKARDTEKENQSERQAARRRLEAAESEVAGLESRIAELTAELEQPDLYLTVEGGKRAASLGHELDRLKGQLDRAFEVWATAQGEVDR
jgi:predicted RNase H-like nuclease (RuvC/YqgF family)